MENFLNIWKSQLQKVGFILHYLQTYPEALASLCIDDLATPDELPGVVEDWLWLCDRFEGMESQFFKPYWIPIESCGYDYFIDVSDDRFPIIEAFYNYFDEPYHWEKKIYFKSITQLMLADDNKVDLKQYRINKIFEVYGEYMVSKE